MLLILAPHPDDAEIHAGGLIAAHVRQGVPVVVVDATRGELGSRGSADERAAEAAAAAKLLGLAARDNLDLRDGHLEADPIALRDRIVDALRRHRPSAVVCLSAQARHPDHIALGRCAAGAVKAAALHRLVTPSGTPALAGLRLWFCEAELRAVPDLLIPLSAEDWAVKMAAIRCYGSQLARPDDDGLPATSIARPDFLTWIEDRGRAWGREAGAPYAEALIRGPDLPRVGNLLSL